MKKIISIIMIVLVGLSIIPKTLTNEHHTVLESTTSVYTKEEVDSLLSAIRTNITNNTNELTNIKSELTTLQNSLKDYALKTSLNTTNSNIDGLNTIVTDHASRIETLESNNNSNQKEYTIFKQANNIKNYHNQCIVYDTRNVDSMTFTLVEAVSGGSETGYLRFFQLNELLTQYPDYSVQGTMLDEKINLLNESVTIDTTNIDYLLVRMTRANGNVMYEYTGNYTVTNAVIAQIFM